MLLGDKANCFEPIKAYKIISLVSFSIRLEHTKNTLQEVCLNEPQNPAKIDFSS